MRITKNHGLIVAGFLLLVLGGCETTSVKDGWDSITDSVGGYLPGVAASAKFWRL